MKLFWILLASIYVGSGVMFYHVRLFELIYLACLPGVIVGIYGLFRERILGGQTEDRLLFAAPAACMAWYAASLLWSPHGLDGIKYIAHMVVGFAIVGAIVCCLRRKGGAGLTLKALGGALWLNLIIAIVETTGKFRWFFSERSPYGGLFHNGGSSEEYRSYLLNKIQICPVDYQFLISNPSGFGGGPNGLAFMLVISLPFSICLIRNRIYKFIVCSLHIYLIFMASSRAAIIGAAASMIVLLILEGLRGKREAMLAPLLALIVIAGMPFLPLTRLGVNALRASKIESIARGVSDFDSRCYNEDIDAVHGDRSVSERWKLVASAFERFKAHPFRGLGAGNSKELISGITSERTYIHNFWLEIMFESGIVMFFIILVWSMVILRRLFTISHLTTSWVENRMAVASIASLIGCIPAALAAETLVAQSSFWLLIGISVGLIFGSRLVGPAGSGPSLGSSE